MQLINKDRKTILPISVAILGIALQIIGGIMKSAHIMTFAAMVILGANFVYCILNIKERILFFWLQITIFTFLLGRPFIRACEGEIWWHTTWLGYENVVKALVLVELSLLAMLIGALISTKICKYKEPEHQLKEDEKKKNFRLCLQTVAMIIFYFAMVFYLMQELEKVFFMHGKNYVQYYTEFQQQLPWLVYAFASFMKYSLCIFLATFPGKKRCLFALALFEISAFPSLIVGIRGQIILNTIFIITYYLIRDFRKEKEKWFGKIEKILIGVGTPLALIFMNMYSYIRSGQQIKISGPFQMIKSFFDAQGVTFEVVVMGIGYEGYLPQRIGRNYTFGGFVDYIVHGSIGQCLFGTEALPGGNSIINGTESNNLAHNLSYIAKGDDYLAGQGWGSSYILENYIDWGYIGVIVFSLILGVLLILAVYKLKKNALINTIILFCITGVFYIPRAEATGWLTFIITLQFWACVGTCYLGTALCLKWKWLQRLLKCFHLFPKEKC